MKIIITLEIKRTPSSKKKSSAESKPKPSNSLNNNIIINQK